MKSVGHLVALGFILWGMPRQSNAQIRDNDSSMITLAVQCAVSSGYSAADYEDYSRRLAKTLSLLSSAQQTRVFGYLPMPSGSASEPETMAPQTSSPSSPTPASGGDDAPVAENDTPRDNSTTPDTGSNSNASSNSNPSTESGTNPSVGNESTGDATSDPGLLVKLVRELNNTIDGTTDEVAPVVAGATGIDLTGSTAPLTDLTEQIATSVEGGKASSGNSGSSWDSLISWFRGAEAAYKAGTLDSFLKGG